MHNSRTVSYTHLDVYKRQELDCDIYITGSNAKLLSGELATYLAGRYVEFVIYPFSFGAFMELYRTCLLYTSRCV